MVKIEQVACIGIADDGFGLYLAKWVVFMLGLYKKKKKAVICAFRR